MRNFKKFLALVLAMLMVSAMAVSAAYTDQDAINATGYEEAVAVLADLGVMQGSGDGSFNPDGTLTRAEAAVIAAKLDTGAAGQKIDWTSGTCSFADVDAAWSFAYINYASQHGIMDGIGGGKFNPTGTLTVAEAIVLAVKAAGLRAEVAALDKVSTPSYWATNWIAVADKAELTANITVFDYTADCSRAMMAQIAYNLLMASNTKVGESTVADLKKGFGLVTVDAEIVSVKDGKVTLSDGNVVALTAFNAALTAAGNDVDASTLKGCKITLTYSNTANVVYGVTVKSDVAVYTYADAKIANVKKDDKLTNDITIDGVTYGVAASDEVNKDIIGGTTSSNGIAVTVDGTALAEAIAIPTYYKAFAYDDDADGDFDRLAIDTYKIATKVEAKDAEDDKKTAVDLITNLDKTTWTNSGSKKNITYTGVAIADKNVPFLYNVKEDTDTDKYVVDVLEVAGVVAGKLVGIGKDYANIDGNKITFVAGAEAVATWTLNQNVSVYTIGGQYVKVAEASKSEIEVVVNSAVITDGKAVITGFEKTNNYADITITIEGVLANGKLASRAANQNTAKDADGKDYNTTVAVGYKDGDKFVTNYELTEGAILAITKTEAGAYITADKGDIADLGTAGTPAAKFEVKGGYIYLDEVASMYTKDVVILEEVVNADAKVGAYNKVSYNKLSTFGVRAGVAYDYVANADNQVTFLYISAGHKPTTTITETKALAEGQSIVYVADAAVVESTFAASIYNAIDLMSGAKVTISTNAAVEAGHYYLVKDGKVVEDTTGKWMGDYTVKVEYTGLVGVVKAQPIVKSYNSATEKTSYAQAGDVLTYGLDKITIYNAGVLDADGNVSKADVAKTLLTGNNMTVAGDVYVVANQMIIVLDK